MKIERKLLNTYRKARKGNDKAYVLASGCVHVESVFPVKNELFSVLGLIVLFVLLGLRNVFICFKVP